MTTPSIPGQTASASSASGPQAQARAQRQAYRRRHTRAKAKSEALRHKEAAHVEALPVLHPHAAGIDIGSRSHWVCVGFTSETPSCLIREFPAHTDGLKAIVAFLREHQKKGEVVTGLLYVQPESKDLHDINQTVAGPLIDVKYEDLCPGNAALEKLQKRYR